MIGWTGGLYGKWGVYVWGEKEAVDGNGESL